MTEVTHQSNCSVWIRAPRSYLSENVVLSSHRANMPASFMLVFYLAFTLLIVFGSNCIMFFFRSTVFLCQVSTFILAETSNPHAYIDYWATSTSGTRVPLRRRNLLIQISYVSAHISSKGTLPEKQAEQSPLHICLEHLHLYRLEVDELEPVEPVGQISHELFLKKKA